MPSPLLDLLDKSIRFPHAYDVQPVKGWRIKHEDQDAYDSTLQQTLTTKTIQEALAEGPWDGIDRLYVDAFEIPNTDWTFHAGTSIDTPDSFFPNDPPHPFTAYWGGKLPRGLSDDQTEKVFGVFRTLRTPNFNEDGQQIDGGGAVVTNFNDPLNIDAFFFYPNPATSVANQILRFGRCKRDLINWPAWCEWRDWNDVVIPWDDTKYTPRSINLTQVPGGGAFDGLIEVRVSTLRGGDESSASKDSPTIFNTSIVVPAGSGVQVSWLIKGDETNPSTVPDDIDGYHIFYRVNGAEWHQITHMVPAARNYTLFALGAGPEANPLEQATAGLMRQVKRFECGLFFIPPYDLMASIDKILQISCADYQWSGLGTGTYRNDMMRFLSPEDRAPVFTLNLAQIAPNSFKTYPIDKRNRPNQIIVNFRDKDNEFLDEADPVILDRDQLQADEGIVKPFTIDGGSMYRGHAQRLAAYFARVLCDLDQMAAMRGSPKTYHVLPCDDMLVTYDTPDWTDIKFKVLKKGENVDKNVAQGDPLTLKIWQDGLYSDTADVTPIPRPLPRMRVNPFAVPPNIDEFTLSEDGSFSLDATWLSRIIVTFRFSSFPVQQIAKIQYRKFGEAEWKDVGQVTMEPGTVNDLPAAYALEGVSKGLHQIRVINSTPYAAIAIADAPFDTIELFSNPPAPPIASDFTLTPTGRILHNGLPTFLGHVQFGAYGGRQYGLLWYRLVGDVGWIQYPGSKTYPALNTQDTYFDFSGLPVGNYEVKFVTYADIVNQTVDYNLHPSVFVDIQIPEEAQPTDLSGLYGVDGTLAVEWVGTPFPEQPGVEKYFVQVWNAPGEIPIHVREVDVLPTTQVSEYGIFEITNDAGFRAALYGDGSVDLADTNWLVELNSINSSSPRGGLYFEYTMPLGRHLPQFVSLYPMDTYGYDGGIDGALMWIRGDIFGQYYYVPETIDSTFEPYRVRADGGTRFGILLRPDGVVEYHVNRRDALSTPIYTSGKRIRFDQQYRVYLRDNGDALVPNLGVRNMRWIRYGNEFRYSPQMQRADFGLSEADPLPSEIEIQVYQYSRFSAGPFSEPATGVFVR